MPKFKKGSKEAKAYMAKIRAKRKKATTKKVGATKIIERGEKKSTPAKKVYQRVRTKTGTFKGLKRVGSTHADTKSHNVKISIGSLKRDKAEYQKKLKSAQELLAKKISDIAFFKEMQKTDKSKRGYYGVRIKETKAQIPLIKKAIINYKKLSK